MLTGEQRGYGTETALQDSDSGHKCGVSSSLLKRHDVGSINKKDEAGQTDFFTMIFFCLCFLPILFSTKIFSPVVGSISVKYIRLEYVEGSGVKI